MEYDNSQVRRQERLLPQERAAGLLRSGEYGVLSMSDGSAVYGVPLNYVWDGESSVYVHCAPEGRKLRMIAANSRVSFCVVGCTNVLPGKFTTEYESIVLDCEASAGLPESERRKALELLVEKYSPGYKEIGASYIEKSFSRTEIIKLDILKWSGKARQMK